ncbi:MAG: hypothetical protein EA349_12835 [Halomonadaceae bacterium]|nr:MAG: hypothetical protein EA349_12835 [Halomonadaceae bacterium]
MPDLQRRLKQVTMGLLVLFCIAAMPVAAELSGANPAAMGNTPGDWHYHARPDDDLERVARRLLSSRFNAHDLQRHNNLSSFNLTPGDTLRIPFQWLQQQPLPAQVTSVTGIAQVQRHLKPRFETLAAGMQLNVGDSIRTGQGMVRLTLADGSTLRVSPHSELILNRLTQFGRTGMADTRLRLKRGRINTQVPPVEKGNSRFEVETPSALAAVRGTAFEMTVEPGGTRLAVTAGQVLFGEPGREQLVPAGVSAWQQPGRPLSRQPLRAAPDLAKIPESLDSLPQTLQWQEEGQGRYRINLINQNTGEWLLSRTLNEPQWQLDNLPDGHYRLELAALDRNGMSGMPAMKQFQVAQPAPPVVLPGSRVIHVNTLGDRVTLFWQTVPNIRDYQLQLAKDASFQQVIQDLRLSATSTSLQLDQDTRYYVRIRAHSGGAEENHWGPVHALSLE